MKTTLMRALCAAALLLTHYQVASAAAQDDDGWQRFRDTYRELVETNTTLSAGDCTLAAALQFGRFRKVEVLAEYPRLAAWDARYRARATAASVLVA